MNAETIGTLIASQVGTFGLAALAILAALIAVLVGLLVFTWGTRKLAGAAGVKSYDYMDSYRNVNFDAVSAKIKEIERRG